MSEVYLRVNGEMLHSFRGQNVCMIGKLNKISPDNMSFELTAPDNKIVNVKLKVPVRDMLSDYVEVYGSVDERGYIIGVNYTTFDNSMTDNFDMDLYNETLQMIYQLPKNYIQTN